MDKELLKKYLLCLKSIKEKEESSPSGEIINDDPDEWWTSTNYEYDLSESEFTNFFSSLDQLNILDITNMANLSEYFSGNKEMNLEGDEAIVNYININPRKLKSFEDILLSLLTPEEVHSLSTTGTFLGEIVKEAGNLKMHTGGLISYNNNHVQLRTGLRNLCEYFIDRQGQLIDRSTLMEDMGIRTDDAKGTVAKYVSALNLALEPHFGRQPIVNYKKEGWRFILE